MERKKWICTAFVLSILFPWTIANTSAASSTSTLSVNQQTTDYQTFVAPYGTQVEALRSFLMSPPNLAAQKIGFNASVGLIQGGYLCGGFKNVFALEDPNMILGSTLDYLNSQKGVPTSIDGTVRTYLSKQFDLTFPSSSYSGCQATGISTPWTYTDSGYDRREFLFGTSSPNFPADMNDCPSNGVRSPNGYAFLTPQVSPPVTAEVQGSCGIPFSGGGINILSMYINHLYLAGKIADAESLFKLMVAAWIPTSGTGVGGSTGGYFGAPYVSQVSGSSCPNHTRDLAYWLEMARATGFWETDSSSISVSKEVVSELWAHQNPDGSVSVDYPSCGRSRDSGESDGLTLVASDPRVPYWFGTTPTVSTSTTSQTTQSPTTGFGGLELGVAVFVVVAAAGGLAYIFWGKPKTRSSPAGSRRS